MVIIFILSLACSNYGNEKDIFKWQNSCILTLPKKWVVGNKLKAGDDVILNVGKEQIVILPKMISRSKKVGEIDTSNLSSDFLIRMIISHYLAGLRIR